jgi:DNA-directed RNA polymerase subunit N (RpoN/RPB10)
MESYREYPIRCKTCNAQISRYSDAFEQLVTGFAGQPNPVEQALNELGITNYCCRIALMTPTIVQFDMENRELIEGFINVDIAEPDARPTRGGQMTFATCINPKTDAARQGPAGSAVAGPVTSQPVASAIQPLAVPKLAGLAPLQIGVVPLPEGSVPKEFIEPTMVGVSVINKSNIPQTIIPVGAGKQVSLLSGRTFLAR